MSLSLPYLETDNMFSNILEREKLLMNAPDRQVVNFMTPPENTAIVPCTCAAAGYV